MNTRRIFLVLIVMVTEMASARKKSCPSFQDMTEDCVCDDIRREVHCKDIINPHSLHSIMNILSEFPLSLFKLSDSILTYIPSGLFKKVRIETLEIYESKILGWESENGSMIFEGTENSLQTIRLYKITGMSSWKWSVFSTLRKLRFFSVRRGDVNYVEKFSIAPDSLEELHLDYANIESIHPEGFSKLEKLIVLSLTGNNLKQIQRSILPNPAKKLRYLVLVDNKLKSLPNDMFIGMPKLVGISLVNNTIRFLPAELFVPLMGREWGMYITDNDLYCCSDMKWIANSEIKKQIMGKCEHPQILKDKELSQLEDLDFTHGLC